MDGNQRVTTENINEVILRLLKLKSGMEMDYQTYFSIIKKKLTIHAVFAGNKLPQEEQDLLIDELNRIRKIKDKEQKRFKIKEKKVKVSSAASPKTGPRRPPSGSGGGGGAPPKTGAIVKSKSGKITADNYFYQNYVEPVNVKDVTKKTAKVSKQTDPLIRISNTLDSILETLTNINNFDREQANRGRRDAENRRRGQRESELESKSFEGIKKALSAITKPFQSIWDRIVNFITNVILGRIVIKLLDWIANPENQEKVKSVIRFLKDWWPALLGSYVLFGTTFGKFIRGATGMVGRFILHIGKVAIPQLLKFIKTPIGAGIALFTAGATIPAMFPGTVNEQERKTKKAPGSTEDKIKSLQQQKANLNFFEKLQGKESEIDEQISFLETGKNKSYGFSGGGLANFGKLFGGSEFNPISSLLGSEDQESKPNGLVSGQKGRDKVPAMLTDGEFVMSTGAVQKYGVDTLEAMNAAGGGTNQPKVIGGKTYASSGGEIEKYPRDQGGGGQSQNLIIQNIKRFIKEKIGYDVDKPDTWGQSFSSIFKSKSSSSSRNSNTSSSGFDFNTIKDQVGSLANNLGNRAQGLANASVDPRSYGGLIDLAKRNIPGIEDITNATTNLQRRGQGYQQPSGSGGNSITSSLGSLLSSIASKPYFGENALIERERNLGLMKPGADSLTKQTRERLNKNDEWIKSLYDEKKDKGIVGETKKRFQDVQDKGLLPDVTKMLGLKSEGFEKFVEKASGGKIKNFGASLQGVQMSLKALSGPLGRLQRVEDDGAMGRYLRPAMMEAQRRGHGGVGRVGLGGKRYDELLQNKIANFALGQTSFMVDESGKAKTGVTGTSADEVWDFNQTAEQNFGQSRKALNNVGQILRGKKVKDESGKEISLGKAAWETGFKGLAGIYRMLQNTAYGNLRPMGSNIGLGEGFKPTDEKGKVLSNQQIKAQKQKQVKQQYGQGVTLYDKPQKNTKEPYKSKFTRPSKPKTPVKPLPKPEPKPIVAGGGRQRNRRGGGSSSSSGSKAPSYSAKHSKGTSVSASAYGIMR